MWTNKIKTSQNAFIRRKVWKGNVEKMAELFEDMDKKVETRDYRTTF